MNNTMFQLLSISYFSIVAWIDQETMVYYILRIETVLPGERKETHKVQEVHATYKVEEAHQTTRLRSTNPYLKVI